MPRPKSKTTIALEKIAVKSGLSVKYLRELVPQGLPLTSTQAAENWLADRPDKSPASSSVEELRRERIRLTKAQSDKAELELAVRRGELLSRTENIESDAGIGQAVSAMLKALVNDLPPLVYGKASQGEIKEIMRREFNRVQKAVADGQAEYWQSRPLGN